MPSTGFEPRLYDTEVSVTNHYTGWEAVVAVDVNIDPNNHASRPSGILVSGLWCRRVWVRIQGDENDTLAGIPFSKISQHVDGRTLSLNRFNDHQSPVQGESSVPTGLELMTHWP
ncbi:hypothetical protein TNCV_4836691 [Trichonephila clavipes]|nr:hypothetical protein TNCV_4836691 [Trichonephila clavipes]